MHIGVLCDPASFHTQKWSQALLRNGAEVTVFSFSPEKCEGIPTVQVPLPYPFHNKISYLSYMYGGKQLKEALQKYKVDIVNPINITPYGVWATRSGCAPIANIAMGADILEYPPDPALAPSAVWDNTDPPGLSARLINRLKYYFYRYQVGKSLEQSAYITGDNLELVNSVIDWFGISPEKVHLNRWGVEDDLFSPSSERLEALRQKFNIKPDQKVVLSPRGMKPIYQGETILDSFAQLLEQDRADTKFIIFSAGYQISSGAKAKANTLLKQYENFHFQEGLLHRKEVLELWALVDVFVSAPLYDGYSNAVAEGRFVGAIPVVNAIPGNREIIAHRENGFIVEPFTSGNLTASLSEILDTLPDFQAKFQTVNREWIMKHSHLDTNVKKFLKDCGGLMGKR